MMVNYFLTFGGGGVNYYDQYHQFVNYIDAGYRLLNQVANLRIFDHLIKYLDSDLKQDRKFWSAHEQFIEQNPKGWGYWIWKPYILLKTLEEMNDGDLLLYCDSGCEVDDRNKAQIIELLEITQRDLLLGSLVRPEWGPESRWCKRDLLDEIGINGRESFMSTAQHQASALFIKKCGQTLQLMHEWYRLASNYHLIDNSLSIHQNLETFVEHRHDQSIFSLLTKKCGLFSSTYLTPDDYQGTIYLYRTKNGISRIKRNTTEQEQLQVNTINQLVESYGYRVQPTNTHRQIGLDIDDLIVTFLLHKNRLLNTTFTFNLSLFRNDNVYADALNALRFRLELIRKLQNASHVRDIGPIIAFCHCGDLQPSQFVHHTERIPRIIDWSLDFNYIPLNTRPYVIFHTKCHCHPLFDYRKMKAQLRELFSTLTINYRVFLLGERKSATSHSNAGVHVMTI